MRIHHLNCVSTCPLGGRLMDGSTRSILQRGRLCCHCLLLETPEGLVLVDTGLGLQDVRNPQVRLSGFFLTLLSPDFREEMTAVRQIERLGFSSGDMRHIMLTHLDFDHAGGLDDFPEAQVHLMALERDYAAQQKTWLDRQRFRPQQWSGQARWKVYLPEHGEDWFGFASVRALHALASRVVMIPLPGHTFGHAGVAVHDGNKWLLQAGDAYFYHQEMDLLRPWCTPGLRFYQTLMEKDRRARLANQERLRQLRREHAADVEVFCSHDTVEFQRLTEHAVRRPDAAGSFTQMPASG